MQKAGEVSLALSDGSSSTDRDRCDPVRVKTVHVKSYGCQMNAYDSERIREALAPHGYMSTDDPDDADLVVLNTCHIRERAAEKVYSELGRLREVKAEHLASGRKTLIAVAGCVAQAEGQDIIAREKAVDLVVGPQSYHRLPAMIEGLAKGGRHRVETEFPDEDKFAHLPPRTKPRAPTAFLTVQEGCDKFCTFCVVPYTRGMEYSRTVAAIVEEARRLVDLGVREVTLLGQNVNAYHGRDANGADVSLASLIETLARLEGLERIRYTTSHPRDMGDDLIAAHRDEPKLMPVLHLPVQSGSDRILGAMNRKHTAAEYVALIERVRKARPDIALSTDIIVGFPGETDEDFAATLALVERIGFAQSFSFKYSARPGTPAATITDVVDDTVASERLRRLQAVFERQLMDFNRASVGRTLPVLFEKVGRNPGQIVGRTPHQQAVFVTGPRSLIGKTVPVEITDLSHYSLGGQLTDVLAA